METAQETRSGGGETERELLKLQLFITNLNAKTTLI